MGQNKHSGPNTDTQITAARHLCRSRSWQSLLPSERSVDAAPLQALCELLHSFGKRRTQPSRLLAAASRRICSAPGALQMRDVSELLWSFAMLQYAGPGADRALGALFKRCSELLRSEGAHVFYDYLGKT